MSTTVSEALEADLELLGATDGASGVEALCEGARRLARAIDLADSRYCEECGGPLQPGQLGLLVVRLAAVMKLLPTKAAADAMHELLDEITQPSPARDAT